MGHFSRILPALALILAQPLAAQSIVEQVLPDANGDPVLQSGDTSTPVPFAPIEVQPPLSDVGTGANLRGLDRINGTIKDLSVAVGETIQYERLEITLLACRYPQGDITADAFAELSIRDIREVAPRFVGWMFASSPALSALDHPRYDVWVLSCQSS